MRALPYLSLALGSKLASADLPVNCRISDLFGKWTFELGKRGDRDVVTSGSDYENLGDNTGTYHFEFGKDGLKEQNSLVTNLE